MEDIEQHGGLGGKTFFLIVNDNTVAMSDYMFYLLFFSRGGQGCSYRTGSC